MSKALKQEIIENSPQAPLPQTAQSQALAMIDRAARDPGVDVAKLRELFDLRKQVAAEEARDAFDAAMNEAQSEMRAIAADANNKQTSSKYASYLALDRAMRPIYTKHGFALSFNTADGAPENHVRVVCDVTRAGHSKRYQADMPADGKGAKGGDVMTKTHAVGAAMTYGQRYLLKMIFNIAVGEDVDGNGPSGPVNEKQLQELIDLCDEVGADKRRFCEYMKVPALAEIQSRDFQRAKTALEAKRGGKK